MKGRILLNRYLRTTGKTQADLVREGGFDDGHLSQWISGKGRRKPGLASAVKLEQVTQGAVPATAWVE